MTLSYLGSPYSLYPAGLDQACIDACKIAARLLTKGITVYSPIAHCHEIAIAGGIDPLDLATAFFGADARRCWIEGPYSPEGKYRDVWHYRLFCDPAWQPISPKGEVYTKEQTPADWRSFSEIHGYKPESDQAPFLLATSESAS